LFVNSILSWFLGLLCAGPPINTHIKTYIYSQKY
jgi:hypothetical protein